MESEEVRLWARGCAGHVPHVMVVVVGLTNSAPRSPPALGSTPRGGDGSAVGLETCPPSVLVAAGAGGGGLAE